MLAQCLTNQFGRITADFAHSTLALEPKTVSAEDFKLDHCATDIIHRKFVVEEPDKRSDRTGRVIVLGFAKQQCASSFKVAQIHIVAERRAAYFTPTVHDQHNFGLGIVPVGIRPHADLGTPTYARQRRRLGEDLGVGTDGDFKILRPEPIVDQCALEVHCALAAGHNSMDCSTNCLLELGANFGSSAEIASSALLDHPLDRRNGKGDASRFDGLQIDRRQEPLAGKLAKIVHAEQPFARNAGPIRHVHKVRDSRGKARHVLDNAATNQHWRRPILQKESASQEGVLRADWQRCGSEFHLAVRTLVRKVGSATNRRLAALVSSFYVGDARRRGIGETGMKSVVRTGLLGTCAALVVASPLAAQDRPWLSKSLSADDRADLAVKAMTQDEKLSLVFSYFATDWQGKHPPAGVRYGSAGYVPGIPRLGITPQWETDAGVGVATQGGAQEKRERTALPSGIATAATWNPDLAYRGGRMIGHEARASGFNVMLAGGVDLARDPRNGRNFEYAGEDPLLAGTIVGAEIAGIQSNHIISTTKHYALNDLETGRKNHDARIDPAAARMSDLLAFQLAIERGDPGSVMCSYNKVNGDFACENDWILNKVLKDDFGFRGYVMSDWGAVHSTEKAAINGLDQESGWPFDEAPYFAAPLKAAVQGGRVPAARLDDMARRVVRALIATGANDDPVPVSQPIDFAADEAVSQADEEQAIVLLKNEGDLLPLGPGVRRIALIGSHADKGVVSGSGSSLVYPRGGNAVPGLEPTGWPGPVMYYASSPLEAIRALAPNARVTFVDGSDPVSAAAAARSADVAIVFANQWSSESIDVPMALPGNQNALISAVAAANPKTAVVLETNAGVTMPWAAQVPAIVEAWYPGRAGGKAIADVLTGKVNPSGHLPVTFYQSEAQLPRPVRPGGNSELDRFTIDYSEGAAVGYKWTDRHRLKPLFPFGHGLSYTAFDYGQITAAPMASGSVRVRFTLRNGGKRAGLALGQVYASPLAGGWESPKRLVGFSKVELAPGQTKAVVVDVDPRLLATFDQAAHSWRIAAGQYQILLGASSADLRSHALVALNARSFPSNWHPGPPGAVPVRRSGERDR